MGVVPWGRAPTIEFKMRPPEWPQTLFFVRPLCSKRARSLEAWPRQLASKMDPQSHLKLFSVRPLCSTWAVPRGLVPAIGFEKWSPKFPQTLFLVPKMGTVPKGLAPTIGFKKLSPKWSQTFFSVRPLCSTWSWPLKAWPWQSASKSDP